MAAPVPLQPPPKRNRSALRQFYGISASGELLPELDRDSFSAEAHVDMLLADKGLRDLLRVENELVNGLARALARPPALFRSRMHTLTAAKTSGASTASARRWCTTTTRS